MLNQSISYMGLRKGNCYYGVRKLLLNSSSAAQFKNFILIWMIHDRINNNRIKYLHGRCLRLICLICSNKTWMDRYLFTIKTFKPLQLKCLKALIHRKKIVKRYLLSRWDVRFWQILKSFYSYIKFDAWIILSLKSLKIF